MPGNDDNLRKIRKSFTGLGFMPADLDAPMGHVYHQIADTARHLAPKETGELADSIEVEVPGTFNRFSQAENRTWAVVVNSDHAAAQEYGTHEMLAQPYLRPAIALANVPGRIKDFVHDAIGASIIRGRR